MNCSTYIFGELSAGYSQYPEDSSSNILKTIYSKCNAPSQLIIHRDENMMYYVYIRKLDSKKYLGFALAINGYYIAQIGSLFSLYEKQVEQLAERGIIINYSKSGDLTTSLSSFLDEEEEVLAFADYLHDEITKIQTVEKLPLSDYAVSIKSQRIFNENDNNSDIVKASYTFGFTVILKQDNYDTIRSTSYRNTLRQLNSQNELLTKEIEKLREKNKKILRQKKQFRKVIFLVLTIVACGLGLYILYNNLNNAQNELITANGAIKERNSIIAKRNKRISILKDSVYVLENSLQFVRREKAILNDELEKISNFYPFIVTESEINSERYMFKYFCDKEKDITVTLKALNSKNSEIITNNHSLTFYKGEGEKSLEFDHKLDTSQYYYVVLMYNGKIIAGKYW